MDTMMIKERNYRTVEMLRHQNEREQRRLEANLYSTGGIEATFRYNLENMNREQKVLKEELAKLRQTTPTTWGVLPPREGEMTFDSDESESESPSGKRTDPFANKQAKRKSRRKSVEQHLKEVELKRSDELIKKFHDGFDEGNVDKNSNSTDKNELSENKRNENKENETKNIENQTESSQVPQLPLLSPTTGTNRIASPPGKEDSSPKESGSSSSRSISKLNLETIKDNVSKRLLAKTNTSKENNKNSNMNNKTHLSNEKSKSPTKSTTVQVATSSDSPSKMRPGGLSPVEEIKEEPVSMLAKAASEVSKRQKATKQLKKNANIPTEFDSMRYNPDGSLRTMHCLPDFQTSLREAMKARYLRMKGKQWVEKELSTAEIFSKSKLTQRATSDFR